VLVMQRFGATLVQIEVLIELLLVAFTAMKAAGGKWPVISEELQGRCLARLGAWAAERGRGQSKARPAL
jgi:hypothetical protein